MRIFLSLLLIASVLYVGACRLNTTQYHSWQEVDKYMQALRKKNPETVNVVKGGTTSEGRPIHYVKISSSGFKDKKKPIIYIDGLNHANEWITVPAITYTMDKLLENGAKGTLLKHADWILLPIMNPDGYVYSFKKDRLWRKNRSKNRGSKCIGVDGNRNFGYGWGDPKGSSNDPCANDFRGPKPFSEPETRVVKDILEKNKDRLSLYISVHAWGSRILYPYNYDGTLPPNAKILESTGKKMANAMNRLVDKKTFPKYKVGNAVKVTGSVVAGDQTDYAQSLDIPLVFGIDLPGLGKRHDDNAGLLLPTKYIDGVVKQAWAGFEAAAKIAIQKKAAKHT